jgi:hypothetical protein
MRDRKNYLKQQLLNIVLEPGTKKEALEKLTQGVVDTMAYKKSLY